MASGGECAESLAINVSGNIESFVEKMNKQVGSTSFQDGVTTHVWPSLPLTDAEGNLYTYSLMNSVAIANYEASVDGLKAVYTYQSPLGSVQGTIQWENGMKLPRPAVEIQLYCNGEAVGEPRKLEAGTTTGVTNQAVSWSALRRQIGRASCRERV